VPESWLQSWKSTSNDKIFTIPSKNPFIPEKLEILNLPIPITASIIPTPTKIVDSDNAEIYYSYDTHFQLPTISFEIHIKSPQIDQGVAAKTVMCDLFIRSFIDDLTEISFQFQAAGLDFSCTQDNDSIAIMINGYSPKVSLLFDYIASMLNTVAPTEEEFANIKSEILRKYQNDTFDTPLEQAQSILKSALYKKYVAPKHLVAAIKKISYESFTEYTKALFKKSFVQAIFYGNLSESEALSYSKKMISSLGSEPYPKNKHVKREILILPKDKGPFYYEISSKSQGNAALLAVAEGDYSFRKRGIQQILMDAIKEPFFTTLRTQQQTGYITDSLAYDLEKQLFSIFFVQSHTYDPRDLLSRFELFIESFLKQPLEVSIPQKAFENIKDSKITALSKPAKNMSDMASLLFLIAFTHDADFEWIQKRINSLQELSYNDFITESHHFLGRTNRQRLAILVKGPVSSPQPFNFIRLNTLNELRKLGTYKERDEKLEPSKVSIKKRPKSFPELVHN
jgi:insulysin